MIVVAGGRGAGKSTKLAAWVLNGHPVRVWPYWSRIAVVSNATLRDHFVVSFGLPEHVVYSAEDFRDKMRGKLTGKMREQVEIGVDEPAILLSHVLRLPVGLLATEADEVWTTAGALLAGNGQGADFERVGGLGMVPGRVELSTGSAIATDGDMRAIEHAREMFRTGGPRAELAPGLFPTAEPGHPRFDRIHVEGTQS